MPTPYAFSFDASYFSTAPQIERADFTKGTYPGLDYPDYYSAIAPSQRISTSGGVDIFNMTMVAGQTYKLDLDAGGNPFEFDVIDLSGKLVATNSTFLSFTPEKTGSYFIVVHATNNDYIDRSFRYENEPGAVGDYDFFVSTPFVTSNTYSAPGGSTNWGYSESSDEVRGTSGGDVGTLRGGNDIALGGAGSDRFYGGEGSDELTGGSGLDSLYGGNGNDVLKGGLDSDRLEGGSGHDNILGGSGNDVIRGGTGVDWMSGGAGTDVFQFVNGEANYDTSGFNEDRITDFDGNDIIDLRSAYGDTLWFRNYATSFTGAGQVRVSNISSSTGGYDEVLVNLDSDSTAEIAILVRKDGGADINGGDFYL